MKEVKLTTGGIALVDDEDYLLVQTYRWYECRHYARTYIPGGKLLMHRLILNPVLGAIVDHKNGNGLDNRRDNIRIATSHQNSMNSCKPKNNKSGYKGVSWSKYKQKWRVTIFWKYRQLFIGYYIDKRIAAMAYNSVATQLYGEFANTNLIQLHYQESVYRELDSGRSNENNHV